MNDPAGLPGRSEAGLQAAHLCIRRTDRGLLAVRIDTQDYDDVTVRRAFPLEAADSFIAFFDTEGAELGILEDCRVSMPTAVPSSTSNCR